MTRQRPVLPDPATCTWLEAEQTAEVLEAFARAVQDDIGWTVPKGWVKAQRWRGKVQVVSRARFTAVRYRQRQLALREDT